MCDCFNCRFDRLDHAYEDQAAFEAYCDSFDTYSDEFDDFADQYEDGYIFDYNHSDDWQALDEAYYEADLDQQAEFARFFSSVSRAPRHYRKPKTYLRPPATRKMNKRNTVFVPVPIYL